MPQTTGQQSITLDVYKLPSIAISKRKADRVPSKLYHQIPEYIATAVAVNKN